MRGVELVRQHRATAAPSAVRNFTLFGVVTSEYVSTNTRASIDIAMLCQPAPAVTRCGAAGSSSDTQYSWRSMGDGRFAVKYTRRARSSTARIAGSGDSPTTMNSPDVSWRTSLPSLP